MRKFVSVILAISLLTVMMTGCSSEKSPTDVVKEKIESYKTNTESLLYGDDDSDDIGLGEDVEKKIVDLTMGFEYTVDNEVIDGDKATVDCVGIFYPCLQTVPRPHQVPCRWDLAKK